jgi:hypothetical protein
MEEGASLIAEYVKLLTESSRMREADVSDGRRVSWGSTDHIEDLENRIADLSRWRDKQKKGSEARANYSRLISRLRAELSSAKKRSEKVSLEKS